jgi:hypothetical protein
MIWIDSEGTWTDSVGVWVEAGGVSRRRTAGNF